MKEKVRRNEEEEAAQHTLHPHSLPLPVILREAFTVSQCEEASANK
jgi:hypothetical protein